MSPSVIDTEGDFFYSSVGFVRRGERRTRIVSFVRISANDGVHKAIISEELWNQVHKKDR